MTLATTIKELPDRYEITSRDDRTTVWKPYPGAPLEGLFPVHYAPGRGRLVAEVETLTAHHAVVVGGELRFRAERPETLIHYGLPDPESRGAAVMTDERFDQFPGWVQAHLGDGQEGDLAVQEVDVEALPWFEVLTLKGPEIHLDEGDRNCDLDALLGHILTFSKRLSRPQPAARPDRPAWLVTGAACCVHCASPRVTPTSRPGAVLAAVLLCRDCGLRTTIHYTLMGSKADLPHEVEHMMDNRVCPACGLQDITQAVPGWTAKDVREVPISASCASTGQPYTLHLQAVSGPKLPQPPASYWSSAK